MQSIYGSMTQACRECCASVYLRFYNSEAGYVKEIAKQIEMTVPAESRMKYAQSFYVIFQLSAQLHFERQC